MFLVHPTRTFLAIRRGRLDYTIVPIYRCLAATTVAIGIYGQFVDSTTGAATASWMNVHTLFGAMLYGAITARFLAAGWCAEARTAAAVHDLTRHLSRLVYLLLYALGGIGISMTLAFRCLDGVAAGHAWHENGVPGSALQPYVAHGITALFLIRIEAAALLNHSLRVEPVKRHRHVRDKDSPQALQPLRPKRA